MTILGTDITLAGKIKSLVKRITVSTPDGDEEVAYSSDVTALKDDVADKYVPYDAERKVAPTDLHTGPNIGDALVLGRQALNGEIFYWDGDLGLVRSRPETVTGHYRGRYATVADLASIPTPLAGDTAIVYADPAEDPLAVPPVKVNGWYAYSSTNGWEWIGPIEQDLTAYERIENIRQATGTGASLYMSQDAITREINRLDGVDATKLESAVLVRITDASGSRIVLQNTRNGAVTSNGIIWNVATENLDPNTECTIQPQQYQALVDRGDAVSAYSIPEDFDVGATIFEPLFDPNDAYGPTTLLNGVWADEGIMSPDDRELYGWTDEAIGPMVWVRSMTRTVNNAPYYMVAFAMAEGEYLVVQGICGTTKYLEELMGSFDLIGFDDGGGTGIGEFPPRIWSDASQLNTFTLDNWYEERQDGDPIRDQMFEDAVGKPPLDGDHVIDVKNALWMREPNGWYRIASIKDVQDTIANANAFIRTSEKGKPGGVPFLTDDGVVWGSTAQDTLNGLMGECNTRFDSGRANDPLTIPRNSYIVTTSNIENFAPVPVFQGEGSYGSCVLIMMSLGGGQENVVQTIIKQDTGKMATRISVGNPYSWGPWKEIGIGESPFLKMKGTLSGQGITLDNLPSEVFAKNGELRGMEMYRVYMVSSVPANIPFPDVGMQFNYVYLFCMSDHVGATTQFAVPLASGDVGLRLAMRSSASNNTWSAWKEIGGGGGGIADVSLSNIGGKAGGVAFSKDAGGTPEEYGRIYNVENMAGDPSTNSQRTLTPTQFDFVKVNKTGLSLISSPNQLYSQTLGSQFYTFRTSLEDVYGYPASYSPFPDLSRAQWVNVTCSGDGNNLTQIAQTAQSDGSSGGNSPRMSIRKASSLNTWSPWTELASKAYTHNVNIYGGHTIPTKVNLVIANAQSTPYIAGYQIANELIVMGANDASVAYPANGYIRTNEVSLIISRMYAVDAQTISFVGADYSNPSLSESTISVNVNSIGLSVKDYVG